MFAPFETYAAQAKKHIEKQKVPVSPRPFEFSVYHRMAFGPSRKQLENTIPFSFEKYVEHQLHPERIEDAVCDQRLREAKLDALSLSIQDLWKNYKLKADDVKKSQEGKPDNAKINENEIRQEPVKQVEIATWIRAVYSERQLQEVLANFWHDHFSVNGWDGAVAPTMVHYDRDVIRKHLFGNFREFIETVAKSPSMLLYLDNGLNQSGNPNENFARELFELHTLGAENYYGTLDRKKVPGYASGNSKGYVDGDVYEAARAFTGWREDSNQKDATNTGAFNYYDTWHDRFQKIILGHSIPEYQSPMKDGEKVLDLVANHEGTAHFISKKLCRRLVSDQPSEALVQKVKKVFLEHRKSKDQLRQVVKAILLSSEFKHSDSVKIKRPFEYAVTLTRALNQETAPNAIDQNFIKIQANLGQRLFQWKTPDGYPDYKERWMTSSGLVHRWQFCNALYDRKLTDFKHWGGFPDFESKVQKFLLGYETEPLTKVLKANLVNVQKNKQGELPDPAVKASVLLAMMSPEFQWK